MKTRLSLIIIALLSMLAMAPDFYLPVVSKPCPEIYLAGFIEYDRYSSWMWGPRLVNIEYTQPAQAIDARVYDAETNQEMWSWIFFIEEDRTGLWFNLLGCDVVGRPYRAKFVTWFEGGCRAEVIHEWIPIDAWGSCFNP